MRPLHEGHAHPRVSPRLAAILARMIEAKLAAARSLHAPTEGMVRPPRRTGDDPDARHPSR